MAHGNGAAVDVEFVVVDAQLVAAVKHLHRKGLVQLPQANIIHTQTVLLEQLGHCKYRTNAHFIGLTAGDRHTPIGPEGLQPHIRDTARILWLIYVGLTGLEVIALWAGAGMHVFDAVCHAFATLATGGFSTKNASIGYYYDKTAAEQIRAQNS